MSAYLIGLAVAAIIAILICMALRSSMKSVHRASSASNYIDPKDFKLLNKKDTYIDKTVTREKIQRNDSNSSGNSSGKK
jgi:hypothetical protein